MNKFVIVYQNQEKPVEAKSKEWLEKKIRQDWEMSQNSDDSEFTSHGIQIGFQDYCNGQVVVLTLDEWFELKK
ncbi:MAG: hypothetical protein P8J32_01235 [bacterium]|nr:hypothetical protein [bacterium]